MLRALLLALLLCQAVPAMAQRADLRVGTVVLPQGWVHQALRGVDSTPGRFVRPGGGFTVHYDIGHLAGTQMGRHRRAECIWYFEHEVGGIPAFTGMIEEEGRRRIITTIGDVPRRESTLANFSAYVGGERDVAEFMMIVSTYVPSPTP